ncbi:hypothetical protein LTR85_000481 [Meristemomyces frigidus]|nr:hypothetical protein LTR85_000481 [Meristemomyces frigidus]
MEPVAFGLAASWEQVDHAMYCIMLDDLSGGGLVQFLSHCRQLQELDLQHPGMEKPEWRRLPLRNMVGSLVIPSLSTLALDNCESTQEELQVFLLAHGETLRKVALHDLRLTENRWGVCFTALSGNFPLMILGQWRHEIELRGHVTAPHTTNEYESTDPSDFEPNALTLRMEQYVRRGGSLPEAWDYPWEWPSDEEDDRYAGLECESSEFSSDEFGSDSEDMGAESEFDPDSDGSGE